MTYSSQHPVRYALRTAFPYTLPIFAGFWFIGLAYGMYMHVSGFSVWYTLAMSMTIFAGSLEFIAVSMLLSPFAPLQTLIVALMVQARHLFYGISMLDKYKHTGWKKPFLIFGLCDETFSINYTAQVPADVDKGWFYLFVAFLNYSYWVSGAVMGNLAGQLLAFNMKGLDFVMTAMFVAIFMEQWMNDGFHSSTWIGLAASVLCLFVFGPNDFMIPTMVCILVVLTAWRKSLERKVGKGA